MSRATATKVPIFGDHPPPHVHVVKSDGRDAIVEIESLRVIGKLASRETREALHWIATQKAYLLKEWTRYEDDWRFTVIGKAGLCTSLRMFLFSVLRVGSFMPCALLSRISKLKNLIFIRGNYVI
jgi:hypothetical protein